MNKTYLFPELQEKISSAQKVLIFLPERPFFDQVASALSLFLSLQKAEKTVFVACPSPMTVEFNHLVGVDKISQKIQGSDLIVSFDYPADRVEKVSYNDDGNRPNLVVQVKNGAPSLTEKMARFSYAGVGADLVITIGLRDPNQLAKQGEQYLNQALINVDIDPANPQYGQVNVVDPESSCLSEVVLGIISGLGLPFDVDVAQNVLFGIWERTFGLTAPRVGADTYEAVAICLRMGAQKPLAAAGDKKVGVFTPKGRFEPREEKPTFTKEERKPPPPLPAKPPSDWFEPKIFKGTSIS